MSIKMNNRVEIKSLLLSIGLPMESYNCRLFYKIRQKKKFCKPYVAFFNHERIILMSNAMGLFLFLRMQTDARA